MPERIVLDTGPLGKVTHPRAHISEPVQVWLRELLTSGAEIYVPEIADYEVRRELIRAGRSVEALNRLRLALTYLPIDTAVMERAAEFWAEARNQGVPTASRDALDGDVILAAQAETVGGIVATEKVGHLSRFVDTRHWRDILPDRSTPPE